MNRLTRHAPAAVLAIAAIAMLIHGPILQPESYHAFADARRFLGLPNAADVLSSLGFAIAALWGLWTFRNAHARRALGASMPGYLLFIVVLLLAAFGSAYYHLAPDDARLAWDRLPIALACAGLLAGAYADTHARPYPVRLVAVLAAGAVASVWWWSATADLRPYVLLQAAPLVLIPIWQAAARAPSVDRAAFGAAIALYVAAKVAELADHGIYEALGFASGHTLKHLLAAAASAAIIAALVSRSASACPMMQIKGSGRCAPDSEGTNKSRRERACSNRWPQSPNT